MVRERQVKINSCPECGADLYCRHCDKPICFESPFSRWLRTLDGEMDSSCTDVTDIDYVINHYKRNWFMTLELKTRSGRMTQAEFDTHSMIAQMLHQASGMCVCRTKRGERMPEYLGHHIVTLGGADPVTSEIWINGQEVTLDELEAFLSTSCF